MINFKFLKKHFLLSLEIFFKRTTEQQCRILRMVDGLNNTLIGNPIFCPGDEQKPSYLISSIDNEGVVIVDIDTCLAARYYLKSFEFLDGIESVYINDELRRDSVVKH